MPAPDASEPLPPDDPTRDAALDRLLKRLRAPDGTALLAELAAAAATGALSAEEQVLWDDLQARARTSPTLGAQLSAVNARVQVLETALEDPLARFNRLAASTPAPAGPLRPRADRPAQGAGARPRFRWGRALVAASVVLAGLVGVVRGLVPVSPYSFAHEELRLDEAGALRGGPEAAPVLDQQYRAALQTLAAAQRAFLGRPLAPRPAALRAATQQLEAVWRSAPAGSFLRLEAGYRLGKARLLLGDASGARAPLEEVVRDGGRFAPEAAALLESSAP